MLQAGTWPPRIARASALELHSTPFAKASGQVSALCTGMNPAGRSAIFAPHKLLPTRLASPVWAALGDWGAQGVLVGRSLEGLAGGMQLQHQFTSLRTAGTSTTTSEIRIS